MKRIVLVRHGESQWNMENRFTGWTNVDLTEKGKEEAFARPEDCSRRMVFTLISHILPI